MVPDRVVPVGQIPATVNGKTDEAELIRIWTAVVDRERDLVPPSDDLEASLVEIYGRVLNVTPVSVLDTFVQLGGHSLLAFQLLDECEQRLHAKPEVGALLTETLRDVAASMRVARDGGRPVTTPTIADAGTLAGALSGDVIVPGDDRYDEARQVWNGDIDRRPPLIARCADADDVATVVRFAGGSRVADRGPRRRAQRRRPCALRGRRGGGPVRMRAVRVELDRVATAHVQGGALWARRRPADAGTRPGRDRWDRQSYRCRRADPRRRARAPDAPMWTDAGQPGRGRPGDRRRPAGHR